MSDRAELVDQLHTIATFCSHTDAEIIYRAIATLSQPAGEPVAWMHKDGMNVITDGMLKDDISAKHPEHMRQFSIPLYTHPTGDVLTPVPAPVDSEPYHLSTREQDVLRKTLMRSVKPVVDSELTDGELEKLYQNFIDKCLSWQEGAREVIAAAFAKRNESTREAVIEECAKVCDSLHHRWHFGEDEPHSGPSECASEIRALSTKAGGETK